MASVEPVTRRYQILELPQILLKSDVQVPLGGVFKYI